MKRMSAGLITILVVVGIFLIAYFDFDLSMLSAGGAGIGEIPQSCGQFDSGTATNQFSCQALACDVNAYYECSTVKNAPIVIARWSDEADEPEKFAYDANKDGILEPYTISTGTISYQPTNIVYNFPYDPTVQLMVRQYKGQVSSVAICYPYRSSFSGFKCRVYDYDTENPIITQPSSHPNFVNKEDYGIGLTSQIQCDNKEWQITDSFGNIKDSGNLNFVGSKPTLLESGVKRLQQGETITFYSGNINYNLLNNDKICQLDRCSKTGQEAIIKCDEVEINGVVCRIKSSIAIPCNLGDVCRETVEGAECVSPIQLKDQFVGKSGYDLGEDIKYTYILESELTESVNVIISLYNSPDPNAPALQTETANIELDGFPKTIIFEGQNEPGKYYIRLKATTQSSKTDFYSELLEFSVTPEISLFIKARSVVEEGSTISTTLYTDKPLVIELRVSQNSQPATIDSYDLEVTQGNIGLLTPLPSPLEGVIADNAQSQVYSFYYSLIPTVEDQILDIKASVSRFGYKTPILNKVLVVKPPTIQIELTNDENFASGVSPGIYTITFETTNPQGNLIDTINKVSVTAEGPTTQLDPDLLVRTGVGQYKFSYEFTKLTGYVFTIESSAKGFVSRKTDSKAINVIPSGGELLECVENSDCVSGSAFVEMVCDNGKCVEAMGNDMNILIYVILGIVIILMIVIIWKLIKKKKPSQVDYGVGFGL